MVRAWGDVDYEPFGFMYSIIRGIFEVALMSITSVFLLQHDTHGSALATLLSKIMACTCAASGFFSFIELCAFAAPYDDPGIFPVIFHLLFFGGRTAILVLGLIPKNVLRLIWVQYKRDDNGGVVISMLAVLMAIDALYLLLAIEVTSLVLCCPCFGVWRWCFMRPVKSLKRRAKMNREVAGRLLEDEDIEIGERH